MQRHEVPTHLNIEDTAFAGLTMRQLMVVITGLALAYAAMSELPLPLPVRLAVGAFVLLTTAAFSLWQPGGRSLEDWGVRAPALRGGAPRRRIAGAHVAPP